MVFRRDSIPRTGGCNWFKCLKRPKTQQERRLSLACPELVRPRRNMNILPNAWDDIPRSDVTDHCWKRNKKRRKQWMR